jgi:hypothetical protein
MFQDEFIAFWRIIYNLFVNLENESEMYHAAATVSTLLLKLGEVSRKYKNDTNMQTNTIGIEVIVKEENEASSIWSITFEQLIASLLTDNLLVSYFDAKYDLDRRLAEYKSQHA